MRQSIAYWIQVYAWLYRILGFMGLRCRNNQQNGILNSLSNNYVIE